MTLSDWLTLGGMASAALGSGSVWLWRRSGSESAILARIQALERRPAVDPLTAMRLSDLERRFDKAGEHTSRLATDVQGLPERMRSEWRAETSSLWAAIRQQRND